VPSPPMRRAVAALAYRAWPASTRRRHARSVRPRVSLINARRCATRDHSQGVEGGGRPVAVLDPASTTPIPTWRSICRGAKVVDGYDFVNGDARPQEHNGHGTHVAASSPARAPHRRRPEGRAHRVKSRLVRRRLRVDGQSPAWNLVSTTRPTAPTSSTLILI